MCARARARARACVCVCVCVDTRVFRMLTTCVRVYVWRTSGRARGGENVRVRHWGKDRDNIFTYLLVTYLRFSFVNTV